MKKLWLLFVVCSVLSSGALAQSTFDVSAYQDYLRSHANLSTESMLQEFAPQNTYYKGLDYQQPVESAAFLDLVIDEYELTDDEIDLLKTNHFVVTERIRTGSLGGCFNAIYNKDLPVFLSTDAVLYALHTSYDQILLNLERGLLEPTLMEMIQSLYGSVSVLQNRYPEIEMMDALADVDLYVTMALSLLKKERQLTQTGYVNNFTDVWNAIGAEQPASMPLFSDKFRDIDFSQFTVRGHYTKSYTQDGETKTLGPYFKTMMWLGRIDFWLTPPSSNPFQDPWSWQDIQRMARATLLMNELMDIANAWPLLQQIDDILTFFVGESDNLTPAELAGVIAENGITVESIADSAGLAAFQTILQSSDEYSQKILSSMIMMDPMSSEPGKLPVSYKLMGQRFIIDSYALGNVVYDKIVYNGDKMKRMMPDPLDAMFVLGNDNALPLLQNGLNRYHYTQNLAGLRYLVDSYDEDYWNISLYNTWLGAIRALNPEQNLADYPLFMQSAAWQHKQLNTQLASWAQLRHDNLLYVKQSYSGMAGCSYPHSYIEPYPAFYRAIGQFAQNTIQYFSTCSADMTLITGIINYFTGLGETMTTLEGLAEKELSQVAFDAEEIEFLSNMLYFPPMCGDSGYSGWIQKLFYKNDNIIEPDYVVADVHTQPTDEFGNPVGFVLHVGTGNFNYGFFIAPSPSNSFQPVVFVGPVMSYYELYTNNFKRYTDEEWCDGIQYDEWVMSRAFRPDWINIYVATKDGNKSYPGREVPSVVLTGIESENNTVPAVFNLTDNYPNPFNPVTTIEYSLPTAQQVSVIVYDVMGRQVSELVNTRQNAGNYRLSWDAGDMPSGVYFYRLQAGPYQALKKMTLVK